MNVVIYARYSSHSQTEQSIEGQLHTCYEYAKNNGYLVVGEYIDRAQSTRVLKKPCCKCLGRRNNECCHLCSLLQS